MIETLSLKDTAIRMAIAALEETELYLKGMNLMAIVPSVDELVAQFETSLSIKLGVVVGYKGEIYFDIQCFFNPCADSGTIVLEHLEASLSRGEIMRFETFAYYNGQAELLLPSAYSFAFSSAMKTLRHEQEYFKYREYLRLFLFLPDDLAVEHLEGLGYTFGD